jgi:hypothetical protein
MGPGRLPERRTVRPFQHSGIHSTPVRMNHGWQNGVAAPRLPQRSMSTPSTRNGPTAADDGVAHLLALQRSAGNIAVQRLFAPTVVIQRWADAPAAQRVLDVLPAATEDQLRAMLASLDNPVISGDQVAFSFPDQTGHIAVADATELRQRVMWRLAERRMEALAQARRLIVAQGRTAATDEVRHQLTDQLLAVDGPFIDEIHRLTTGRPDRFAHPNPDVADMLLAALQLDAVGHAVADLGDQANAHARAAGGARMAMHHDWCGFFAGQHLVASGYDSDLRSGLFHTDNVQAFFQYHWAERNPRWIWADNRWYGVHEYHTMRGSLRGWLSSAALSGDISDIRPGDVLLVDTDGNRTANHIVLVHSYNPLTKRVITIGGNDSGLVLDTRENPPPAANDSERRREAATGRPLRDPAGLAAGHVGVGEQDLNEHRTGHAQVFGVGRPSIVDFEDHRYDAGTTRPNLPPNARPPRPRTRPGG